MNKMKIKIQIDQIVHNMTIQNKTIILIIIVVEVVNKL